MKYNYRINNSMQNPMLTTHLVSVSLDRKCPWSFPASLDAFHVAVDWGRVTLTVLDVVFTTLCVSVKM